MQKYFFSVCLLLTAALHAQPTAEPACTCLDQFNFFEEKIRINYSGFSDKVHAHNSAEYLTHTAKYRRLAAGAMADTTCYRIMSQWKNWFNDGHVQIQSALLWAKPEVIRQRFADWEKIEMDVPSMQRYLSEAVRAPVEGVWRNKEGNYTVAITRQPKPHREFAASILNADGVYWSAGQVKFELSTLPDSNRYAVRFFMRDHSLQLDTAILIGDTLRLSKLGPWRRLEWSGDVLPQTTATRPNPYRFALLDSATALLVIPTMDVNQRKLLDQVMKANKKNLKRTPNLIIDCRNNGGGSDITFRLVTPYLYTNRVKIYNAQIWATRDNAGKYAAWQQEKSSPWYLRIYAGAMKRKILRHEGTFIGKKKVYTSRKLKKRALPKRVAILINENCASSCESFIEIARQSKKVTLIGVNTAGVSDYGNLHTLEFPCGPYAIRYPTTRSCAVDAGKGIDGTGIPPDIRLEPTEKDWVEFARQYLHRQSSQGSH